MKVKIFFGLIMLFCVNVYAVPGFIVHQGYMEDSEGKPVNGVYSITIGIYGSPDGDDILFEQVMDIIVENGFYTAEINDSAIMPVFDVDKDLYLEISIGSNKGKPRQKIGSVPYAFFAAKAYDVIGEIHPESIYINGIKVIDETGKYLGPINAVTSITAGDGLEGGTITSTGTISLSKAYQTGEIYDDRFVNNNEANSITTDMIVDGAITSNKIASSSITLNHISDNGCTNGQIMKYNGLVWVCSNDNERIYQAGTGLTLDGNTFIVNFEGNGTANTVARSDHNHDGSYVNVTGDNMTGSLDIQIDSAIETPIALTTHNGSILFEGPDGFTPAKGEGIRMMWIPSKIALRAGYVSGTQWDDSNIGKNTYVIGTDSVATGSSNFIFGDDNNASGDYSFIFGSKNSIELVTKNSTAIGNHITIADSSSNSTGIGSFINVKSNNSITIGHGDESIIGGPLINTIDNSLMVGFNSMKSTLFVGPSSGGLTTGNVGIGVTDPTTKLDVDGGVRTRVFPIKHDNIPTSSTETYTLTTPDIKCGIDNRGEIRVLELNLPVGNPFDALCACMMDSNGDYFWNCYR